MNRYSKYLREVVQSIFDGSFSLQRCYCSWCERRTWFLVSGSHSRSIRCLSCRATAISLASLERVRRLPLDPERGHAYELSYHGVVFNWLKRRYARFTWSEYFGPKAPAFVNGTRNEDVQRLTFENASFDLVTSTEVFEHVPDYRRGFREVRRVLREGGWFVFTVPLYDGDSTRCVCRLQADGSLEWQAEPEYHDSQVTGVASVPVFWHHSRHQIVADLLAEGFAQAEVTESREFVARTPQWVVVARC
jgi:SAM-dependent methyltransferase